MAGSGFASIGNFRKHLSNRSQKTKYPTIIKTEEDLLIEAKMLEE